MEPDKELHIKITGTAAVAVAEAAKAERAIEQVGETAHKVSEEQKEAAQAAARALSAPSYGEKLRETLGQTGDAAQKTSRSLGDLKQSGQDVGRVFRGLQGASEGGVRGIIGLSGALQGLVGLVGRVGAVLAGPLGVGLGAAAAGIAFLGRRATENQRAIEKIFAAAAERSAATKKGVEELQVAAEKSLKAQLEEVDELTKAYDRLTGAIDAAGARAKALNDARSTGINAKFDRDEQAALARAKTPKERARISADFASKRETFKQQREVDALTEGEANAKNRASEAERAARDISNQRESAASAVAAAQRAKQNALDNVEAARQGRGAGSEGHLSAIEQAKKATRALELAEEGAKSVREKTEPAFAKAQAEIETAQHTLEMLKEQRKTVELLQEANKLARANAAKPQIEELKNKAQSASEAGMFDGQDKANAERRALEKDLARVPPAVADAMRREADGAKRTGDVTIRLLGEARGIIGQSSADVIEAQKKFADGVVSSQQALKSRLNTDARRVWNQREQTQ